jgi:hypothetical protein
VTGTDDPNEYIRRALRGKGNFGDYAHTFVARDPSGKVTGAMTVVDHDAEEENEYGVPVPAYSTIDYVGAKGGGRDLVRQAAQHALDRGAYLYAEPTSSSLPYWRDKIGMTEDPGGLGTDFYGFSPDELRAFLSRTGGQ